MTTACTASGRLLNYEDIDSWRINLHDIAFALSQLPRFNGHAKHHYSVALHSINVATMAAQFGGDADTITALTRLALIHDAHEAYVQDIITPLKHSPSWKWPKRRELEYTVQQRIYDCLHFPRDWLSATYNDIVHDADDEVLRYEIWFLMHPNAREFFQHPWEPWLVEGSVGKAVADTMLSPVAPNTVYIQYMLLLEAYFPEADKGV